MTEPPFDIDSLVEDFLIEAPEDYIGLWQITSETRDAYGESHEAQEVALVIVRRLLDAGLQAGQFKNFVFETWPDQNVDSVIARIRREWDALDAYPSIGDIAWFCLPR